VGGLLVIAHCCCSRYRLRSVGAAGDCDEMGCGVFNLQNVVTVGSLVVVVRVDWRAT
jgi:hypothetical protein